MNERGNRRSIRLKHFDYTGPAIYFVTICTKNRKQIFGQITNKKMILSNLGKQVVVYWNKIQKIQAHVTLDEYVVMPDHMHGILHFRPPVPPVDDQHIIPLGLVIRGFKTEITKWSRTNGFEYDVWQRNYYEHIVRDTQHLSRIRQYIRNNPAKWNTPKTRRGR